jgi:pimeloyl-ACP methyl ester carboxylesterase
MPTKFPRCGGPARSRSPTTPATTAWPRSRAEFWRRPRRASLSLASRWAATSLSRSCAAPERVGKLALLDTGARGEAPAQIERRKAVIALAKRGRYAEVADIAFPIYVHRDRQHDVALKRVVRAMAGETGVDAFLRQQHAIMGRPDSRPGLGAIKCPTLVLVGDDDQATPPELSREIAAGVPASRLVVIADSGHLSTLEQPERVTEALVAWMSA